MTPHAMTQDANGRLPQNRGVGYLCNGEGCQYGDRAQLFRGSPPLEIFEQPGSFADYLRWYDR